MQTIKARKTVIVVEAPVGRDNIAEGLHLLSLLPGVRARGEDTHRKGKAEKHTCRSRKPCQPGTHGIDSESEIRSPRVLPAPGVKTARPSAAATTASSDRPRNPAALAASRKSGRSHRRCLQCRTACLAPHSPG